MNNIIKKSTSLFFAVIFLIGINCASAFAQEEKRYITVSGQGEVSAEPDTVWISSGVHTRALTAAQALEENSEKMNAVVAVFLDADIDKKNIQTSGFNISAVYDYSVQANIPGKPAKLVGYQVTNYVTVKIAQIKKLAALLDELVNAGSNQISGIRFGFDDQEALLNQARKKAIENAKSKAQLYADTANVDVGDVISINEMGTHVPGPVRNYALSENMKMMADSAPVMSGEQEVRASITVVYRLED